MLTCQDIARAAGITLTPGQKSFVRVAYDGERPDPEDPVDQVIWGVSTERQWPKNISPAVMSVAVQVAGRGSGKSLFAGLRGIHLAATVDLSKLQPREVAFFPVISTDIPTATQVVRYALGIAESLGLNIEGGKDDSSFSIYRGSRRVLIEAKAAGPGGRAIRGRSLVGAALDEFAFFRDKSAIVNDVDIYDAVEPRIMKGGQIVILSSPWIEQGMLYELYRQNYGHPIKALCAHAPTSFMRTDDEVLLEKIELERVLDPAKVEREYDGKFSSTGGGSFVDPRVLNGMFTIPEWLMAKAAHG